MREIIAARNGNDRSKAINVSNLKPESKFANISGLNKVSILSRTAKNNKARY
jgi:hypothetical protein